MSHRFRFALPLLLLAATACSTSTNALGPEEEEENTAPAPPEVVLVAPADLPPWDSDVYKASCYGEASACPVVTYDAVDYVALSFIDNRLSFAIHAYDAAGTLLSTSEAAGARYLQAVRVDTVGGTVTFIGQAEFEVVRTLTELEAIR